MGNSSKKQAVKNDAPEGASSPAQDEQVAVEAASQLRDDVKDQTNKSDKSKKTKGKVKKQKDKKEKKKKKGEKDKGASRDTDDSIASCEAPIISDGTNFVDLTNFNGDSSKLSEAVTISVEVEPRPTGEMRGKENSRPLTTYEGRSARPTSPAGPGVSALREMFGGAAAETPSRPISYPASRFQSETPKGELHQPVHRKPFGYNRAEETPQKQTGIRGRPDGNVSALKQKFSGASPATPSTNLTTTPLATSTTRSAATPSKDGAVASRWQPKQASTPTETTTRSPIVTTTAPTTTKSATGISALRDKWNNNAEGRTNSKPAGQLNSNPEKKRRIVEEQKSGEEPEVVKKENEKNRSPRKLLWSPTKEPKTPNRDGSPTKDASPRKRKSAVLKFGSITRGKTRQDTKDKKEESAVARRTNLDKKSDEAEKEKARQMISNRTSALIQGTPKTTTPSRIHFEETVPKRTRREDSPKERPKTDYHFQSVNTPRPKSIADTRENFSSPCNLGTTPGGGANIIKNPTTKTQKLLQWCQIHTQGYAGVSVSNFSSSWADGLAFCALVHKFHPTAFNFNSLSGSNKRHNLDLAFSSAEKFAKVSRLLDTDDMLVMGDKPDWKCVFTYITALYAGLNKNVK